MDLLRAPHLKSSVRRSQTFPIADGTLVHQIALSTTAVQSWTLSATRIGLISQNKEGLVSLPGYFAIYALGLATGEHIIRSAEPTKGKQSDVEIKRLQEKSRTDLALELFGYGVAWWAALAVWRYSGGAMSRRLVSLSMPDQRSATVFR